MQAIARFLKYAKIHTTSDPDSASSPSTPRQLELARVLAQELRDLGFTDVRLTAQGYVYGKLPATPGLQGKDAVGLIAHMDTSPDFCGENVQPRLIENYDGGPVQLGHGRVLSPAQFSHLPQLQGRTLVVAGGDTLLGADDKAGVAEILTACERLIEGGCPHGPLCVAFTPDEEVGRGTEHFDIKGFGARYAYTVDGGDPAILAYENFNGCDARVHFHGFNVHPGSAKDKMKNASLMAIAFNAMLPAGEVPAHTQERQGFFHLCDMQGNTESASLHYIVRDHSAQHFAIRKQMLQHIAALLNEQYGPGSVELSFDGGYRNMAEYVLPYPQVIENAKKAIAAAGLAPQTEAIRGGTDGATLSVQGLPCPNLGTGGYAYHGPYEHLTVEGMEQCVQILLHLVQLYAE